MKNIIILLLFTCGIATAQTQPEIRYQGRTYVPVGNMVNQLTGFTESFNLYLSDAILSSHDGTLRTHQLNVQSLVDGSFTSHDLVGDREYSIPGAGRYRVTAALFSDGRNTRTWFIEIDACGNIVGS